MCELCVASDLLLWCRNAYMSFIDSGTFWLGRSWMFELITRWRIPESILIHRRHREVLSDSGDPGWQSFDTFSTGNDHRNLDLAIVRYDRLTIFCRQCYLPDTKVVLGHWGCASIPAIEVADEKCLLCIGSPFSVCNVSIRIHIEPVLLEAATELFQATLGLIDRFDPVLSFGVSVSEGIFERCQPGI